METNQVKKTATYALVAFALLTIGFALGKEVTLRRLHSAGKATASTAYTLSVRSRTCLPRNGPMFSISIRTG